MLKKNEKGTFISVAQAVRVPVEAVVSNELRGLELDIPKLLVLKQKAKAMVDSEYSMPAIVAFETALKELK